MKNTKYSILRNYLLVLITVFILSFIWEFLLEPSGFLNLFVANNEETDSERWEYVFTVTAFCLLALIAPTVLSIKQEQEKESAVEEVKLRSKILTNIGEGVCLWRLEDNIIIYTNNKFTDLFGFSSDEIIGTPFSKFNITSKNTAKLDGYEEIRVLRNDGTAFWYSMVTSSFTHSRQGKLVVSVFQDISKRKQADSDLREIKKSLEVRIEKRTRELEQKNKEQEESNIALKILMQQQDQLIRDHEKSIISNVEKLIFPSLENLKRSGLEHDQSAHLEIIETNLNQIVSPFGPSLSSKLSTLTPAEIQVANLIKQGKSSKEIASLLNLSPTTISTQRQNIRKKLGLTNKKQNLQAVLSTSQ